MSFDADQLSPRAVTCPGGGPPSSRWRLERACDACRRRKARCTIQEGSPRCAFCASRDHPCTFEAESEPRKRKSISNGADNQRHKKRSLDVGNSPTSDVSETPLSARGVDETDQQLQDYAKLPGPSLLKETLGLQNHRHSCFVGDSDEFEPAFLAGLVFRDDECALPHGGAGTALRRVGGPRDVFLLRPDAGSPGAADEPAAHEALQRLVAPHGPALVALYFRIVHPSYPILHRRVFLEKHARSRREFAPPLLAAVYALALRWWAYDPALLAASAGTRPDAAALHALALAGFHAAAAARPKLSTVQAGLLLAHLAPAEDRTALTACLVAVARTLGLDRDCSAWRIPGWERELRRRLAWALYMQDVWVALTHGRPMLLVSSTLDPEAWPVPMVTEHDFPETGADENDEEGSAEVEKGREVFIRAIHLSCITAMILQGAYGVSSIEGMELFSEINDETQTMLQWAKPLQVQLKQWYAELPTALRMEAVPSRKLSSTGSLHLLYISAEITLRRRMIRHLATRLTTISDEARQDVRAAMSACHAAATARFGFALRFASALRPVDLQSFWYFPSAANLALVGSFGVLLWSTAAMAVTQGEDAGSDGESSGENATLTAATNLRDYRWALRVNAPVADFVAEGLSRVERCTSIMQVKI